MTCAYCGIANDPGQSRCAGCGAYGTSTAVATPSPTASLYEQIGRAVVDREHGNALHTLARLGEREEASSRETRILRAIKIMCCLFVLWHFPFIVVPLVGIGVTFFLWVYLPYRGVKAVVGWLSS